MTIIQFDAAHAIAGGAAGCAGAVVTSPLEIVKTRLQSSVASFQQISQPVTRTSNSSSPRNVNFSKIAHANRNSYLSLTQCFNHAYNHPQLMPQTVGSLQNKTFVHVGAHGVRSTGRQTITPTRVAAQRISPPPLPSSLHRSLSSKTSSTSPPAARVGLVYYFRYIIQREGFLALYKGLLPTLIGVVPSRSIFFSAYESFKQFLYSTDVYIPSTVIHMSCSAVAAFTSCTLTNPIWFMKTRLQLDESIESKLTIRKCFRQVLTELGPMGFYKGLSASYAGISETVIHIAIYEHMKRTLYELRGTCDCDPKPYQSLTDHLGVPALAAFVSKSCASFITYPTEVARTRLRQSGSKYRGFFQTLGLVFREEGFHSLFRGVTIQVIQKVPNTMVTMVTYELVSSYLMNGD